MTTSKNKPFNKTLQMGYHPFLHGKGITRATAEFFGVGYVKRGTMKGRVAIPLHNPEGVLVGYIGRAVNDKAKAKWFHLKKFLNPSLELFNLHRVAEQHSAAYLFSNPFLALKAWQEGETKALAMTGPILSIPQATLLGQHFEMVVIKVSPTLQGKVAERLKETSLKVYP